MARPYAMARSGIPGGSETRPSGVGAVRRSVKCREICRRALTVGGGKHHNEDVRLFRFVLFCVFRIECICGQSACGKGVEGAS